jgi:hypothetical protein
MNERPCPFVGYEFIAEQKTSLLRRTTAIHGGFADPMFLKRDFPSALKDVLIVKRKLMRFF